jgi:hypothetical protein
VPFGRNRESRSREAAGRRNWPEQCPGKCAAEKGERTELDRNCAGTSVLRPLKNDAKSELKALSAAPSRSRDVKRRADYNISCRCPYLGISVYDFFNLISMVGVSLIWLRRRIA